MKPFDYRRAESVDDAGRALGADVRPLAGGTDLLTRMKAGIDEPSALVDLKTTDLPDAIEAEGDGVRLGALVTLAEIETSELLAARYPLLVEAAAQAATPQLRNRATIAGNLLQRPRCWYYRNPQLDCWLKGGEGCPAKEGRNEHHALFGDGPCVAVHPSDLASCLLALDATVAVRGQGGARALPVADLFAPPEEGRRRETTLADDELIESVDLPALPDGTASTYVKAMDRKVWAFALVGAACTLRVEGGVVADARLVLSGVANVPWRASEAEAALVGEAATAATFTRAADAAVAGAAPLAHNGYKVPLARSLVLRALATLSTGA